MRERIALSVVAFGLVLGACGADGESRASDVGEGVSTEWEHLHDIVYLLPEELPDGWSVHVATERPGQPRSEWTDRFEVLGDGSEDRFLVLASTLTGDESTSDHPGSIQDLPVDGFAYLFGYVVGTDPSPLKARGVGWRDNGVEMSVTHIGSTPDDRLTEEVADELASDPRFDFEVPASAIDAGFTPLGSASGSTDDLADYTVSWVPSEMAGEDRAAAVDAPDEGPTIFINVGARFYGQIAALGPGDALTAPISRDGELLRLEFLMSGAPISVSGRAVTDEELRDFAASLVELDRDAWRRGLGDRLLIDDPDP